MKYKRFIYSSPRNVQSSPSYFLCEVLEKKIPNPNNRLPILREDVTAQRSNTFDSFDGVNERAVIEIIICNSETQ